MTEERCKGCGRKVYFAVDMEGKNQILDAVAPVYMHIAEDAPNALGTPSRKPMLVSRVKNSYVSHFSTCKFASEFSKKGKGGSRET